MRLTLIHPSIGRRPGKRYIRTWQMEPLPVARIAGLTPPDVDIRFYDDRMENIPFDEETDLVALSVETYTARRAYQIATEYRRRNVPVVMGGFHATLCTEEVSRFAETVVIGEAEGSWPQLISDFRHGRLQRMYREKEAPSLAGLVYNRNIYRDKRYLPLGLIETGRGCPFTCEFCAIQSFFHQSHRRRPVEDVVREIEGLPQRAFFFVDDNFASDLTHAKHLLRALIPLKIRWITQMTINAARDREFLSLLGESGCQGVLIGFETLDEGTLKAMDKGVNLGGGGYDKALENLRHHGIRVYGTFIFGYDNDTPASFDRALEFAGRHRFYMAAFNHLTPFPGTPLYRRLKEEGRLTNPAWWLDSSYRYNNIPFQPKRISPESLQENCIRARKEFFGLRSMLKRGFDPVNRSNMFMLMQFFMINGLHRLEISRRNHHPLGQEPWNGPLLEVSPEPRALRA